MIFRGGMQSTLILIFLLKFENSYMLHKEEPSSTFCKNFFSTRGSNTGSNAFNLHCNNVAGQVEQKCCPYYSGFMPAEHKNR